jgi:hypothetical protein
MNKTELIELIYTERAKVAEEYERADDSTQLGLLEGWENALKWVIRQLNTEEVSA